jgi:hypothetical protein
MPPVNRYVTTLVIIHAIAATLHGFAHMEIPVALSALQILFVGSVIMLAPISATILLWTRFGQAGSWLLLGSMAGALLFGLYNHFIAISPDHVSQILFAGWGVVFNITAVFLFFIEGIGCVVGVWAVKTLQRKELVL